MKELKDFKNSLATQMKIENLNKKKETKKLMRTILRQQKLTDYSVCHSKRLTGKIYFYF